MNLQLRSNPNLLFYGPYVRPWVLFIADIHLLQTFISIRKEDIKSERMGDVH